MDWIKDARHMFKVFSSPEEGEDKEKKGTKKLLTS
jgi:hypothetical protein